MLVIVRFGRSLNAAMPLPRKMAIPKSQSKLKSHEMTTAGYNISNNYGICADLVNGIVTFINEEPSVLGGRTGPG